MSAPMVRALLDGTKTQTRRVVKLKPWHQIEERDDGSPWPWMHDCDRDADFWLPGPYGVSGDRLYCRETWAAPHAYDHLPPRLIPQDARIHYAANEERGGLLWRPSIHMPRWASRILLEVTDVRVERLQDISEADALAEGIEYLPRMGGFALPDGSHFHVFDPRISYWSLWDAINGPGAVEANPWVWCVSFERVEGA